MYVYIYIYILYMFVMSKIGLQSDGCSSAMTIISNLLHDCNTMLLSHVYKYIVACTPIYIYI